jgi:hypothetical protein
MMPTPYSVPGATNQLKARSIEQLLQMGLLSAGAGMALRGASGALNLFDRNTTSPPKIPNRTVVLPIRMPVRRQPEEEKLAAAPAAPAKPGLLSGIAENLGHMSGVFAPVVNGVEQMRGPLMGRLMGDNAATFSDIPWAWPASAAALGGGLYGGYKLTDSLFDSARKNEVDSELAAARNEYEQALNAQHLGKQASDDLDFVYEKRAIINKGLGMLGLLNAMLAGGAGLATYNWARSRSEGDALNEAVRRRNRQLYDSSPRPVIAMPVPYHMPPAPKKPAIPTTATLMPPEEEKIAALPSAKSNVRPKGVSASQAASSALQRMNQRKMQMQQSMQMRLQQNQGGFSQTDLSGMTTPT